MDCIHHITSLDDPLVAPYRNLKDRELAREGNLFIAEGEHVVRRLLTSDFPVESVLLAERRVERIRPLVPPHVPVYVVADEMIHRIVGFKFHSGVIACGRRKPRRTLNEVVGQISSRATILICPEIANTENLGGLMRVAAGFGAEAMVLGPRCCDPFYRQSIRVSMGAVFRLNLFRSDDLISDLRRLKQQWEIELVAAVVDESAQPLHRARRCGPMALLLGNEAQGLDEQVLAECDRKITIPMKLGTDSLNVVIAAAVFLYHFCKENND